MKLEALSHTVSQVLNNVQINQSKHVLRIIPKKMNEKRITEKEIMKAKSKSMDNRCLN